MSTLQQELTPHSLSKNHYYILRADPNISKEILEATLDQVLATKINYVIVEPSPMGDETSRFIAIANGFHKTAVVSGAASIICSLLWRDRPLIAAPFCAVSLVCTGLYTFTWNVDPCSQYQVEKDEKVLSKLPLADLSSPVVLTYSPNTVDRYLNRSVTILSTAFCVWQIWRLFK